MSYGFSHDTFNIDMVLNFIGRFGEERLYDVKDLLNEPEISKTSTVDRFTGLNSTDSSPTRMLRFT